MLRFKSSYKRAPLLLFLSTLLVSGAAQASTQGTLGATSTGSSNISITKSVQAQITDISDMSASWSIGQSAIALYSNVCIYSSTGSYKVTASGSGTGSAFTLASGSNTLPYSVVWNAGGAGNLGTTGTTLSATVQSTSFTNAGTASATCSGGGANDTARVNVNVLQSDITAASSSATPYTGTLTMLITPF
jgi:hypothetical protein